jgi:hypothetical protein
MENIEQDLKGFTCTCGMRNDYPGYVQDHWSVKLAYACSCHRRYILFRGRVTTTSTQATEVSDGEAFGD